MRHRIAECFLFVRLMASGWLGVALIGAGNVVWTAPPAPPVDYQQDVRPVFDRYCVRCHGPDKQQADLRLDTRQGVLQGGNSGPAVVVGDPDASILMRALRRMDDVVPAMPPEGEPRPGAREVEIIQAWILHGVSGPAVEEGRPVVRQTSHWAFQPIHRPALPWPRHDYWAREPIDVWVLEKLEEQQLAPSPDADRETLLRRVYLDLIGLPPSPQEVSDFLADSHPDAYERVVDRLLASPHYGERWARRWLDVARYADSNGYTRDMPREIWPYRDWVIAALNAGMPFDQFVIEQLAGDLLPSPTLDQLVATGFHRNTLFNEEGGTDPEQFRVERTVDRVNTTGTVFLGLSVGCAQCHDHKYDPISQREYYELFAFFNNAEEPRIDVPTREQIAAGDPQRKRRLLAEIAQLEKQLADKQEELEKAELAWEAQLTDEQKQKLPFQVLNAIQLARQDRTPELNRHLFDYFKRLPETRRQFPILEEVEKLRAQVPQFATTLVMAERKQPRATHVHIRGDFLRPGAAVQPSVPAVLPPLQPRGTVPDRLDLAHWLMHPAHPLTARVTVNRFWQDFFGRGLVETENDFGSQGTPPSHPQLLDWLAAVFQENWDIKRLHRQIVLSATYRQSSRRIPQCDERDPNNVWLWRQNRLRLDAELIRDSALSVSGLLTYSLGGPGVYPPQPEGVFDFTQDKKPWPTATGRDRYRRSLYTYLYRSSLYPSLVVFDFPDANATCTRRIRSNTPLQSLALSNDILIIECARQLAKSAMEELPAADDAVVLQTMFRRCLVREPSPREQQILLAYYQGQQRSFAADPSSACRFLGQPVEAPPEAVDRQAAWTAVARTLMNLDEFITRE